MRHLPGRTASWSCTFLPVPSVPSRAAAHCGPGRLGEEFRDADAQQVHGGTRGVDQLLPADVEGMRQEGMLESFCIVAFWLLLCFEYF